MAGYSSTPLVAGYSSNGGWGVGTQVNGYTVLSSNISQIERAGAAQVSMNEDLTQAYIENIQRENYSQMMWGRFSEFNWAGYSSKASELSSIASFSMGIQADMDAIRMFEKGYRRGISSNYLLTGSNLSRFGSDVMTNTTKPISKLVGWGKGLGIAGFVLGVGVDVIGVWNYYNGSSDSYKVHPGKASIDLGFGVYGFTGIGTAPSLLYFGVDSFYPGGWSGYLNDSYDLNQVNHTTNNPYTPNFNFPIGSF